jgi:spore maturation protein CgeB
MKFVLFYHSFSSCWNHGNAHFLRGIARVLIERGHLVTVYEPADGWSRVNALRENNGAAVLEECAGLVPGVDIRTYALESLDLDRALEGAEVVVAHEWNDPALIARLGERRLRHGGFLLLFHDTHHRAVTAPHELERFKLEPFDFVLVFGEVLRQVYSRRGWGRRVVTWHEAADVALFRPTPAAKETDLIWIGNWGDGERDGELRQFLVEPLAQAELTGRLHGVRYPNHIVERAREQGLVCAGWLPNHRVPDAFARGRFTMHVPRRPYVEALPGIPTIRMFEALACGIPLISAPWHDAEGLFPPNSYLTVRDRDETVRAMRAVMRDAALTSEITRAGRRAIAARHTCAHRVNELLSMLAQDRPIADPRSSSKSCARMVASWKSPSSDRAWFRPIGTARQRIIGACSKPLPCSAKTLPSTSPTPSSANSIATSRIPIGPG